MKKTIGVFAVLISISSLLVFMSSTSTELVEAPEDPPDTILQRPNISNLIQEFLESKNSPLSEHTELLLEQSQWELLVAISAIESQYCQRKISYNCWGIGGDKAYRHYDSYQSAIIDANNLIVRWQSKGRWLTVSDMNGHYVVPYNPNWERVVNSVLKELNDIQYTATLNQIINDSEGNSFTED